MSDAQQGLAPDCLQRALRFRFRQQVKPGVRRTTHSEIRALRFGREVTWTRTSTG